MPDEADHEQRVDGRDDPRERRRQRLIAEIEQAALRLFVERGYDAVTVEDIADAVDISRRTFFRYFASKDDVLLGDPHRRACAVQTAVAGRPAGEPLPDVVRHAVLCLADVYQAERELVLLRTELVARNPSSFTRRFTNFIAVSEAATVAVAEHSGVPVDDLRLNVVVSAALTAFNVALGQWLRQGAGEGLRGLVEEALDLVVPAYTASRAG